MARRAALWLALLVDRAGVAVASACDHFPDGTCQNETATPEEAVLLQHQTPNALEVAAGAAEAAAANACKGKKEKVTVKLDGKIIDHTVANFFPVDVGQGGKLQIAVCNSWNIDTDGDITTPPVMPDALVGAVGAKAEVDIVVSNSGNVDIGGKLALGSSVDPKDIQDETDQREQDTDKALDDLRNGCKDDSNLLQRGLSAGGAKATARETAGRRERRAGRGGANGTKERSGEERAGRRERSVRKSGLSGYMVAMLPKMVTGKVDLDALIKITVTKSANVNLKKQTSSVQISGATLMNELVSSLAEDLVQATIKIDVMSSANVNAASKGGGSLLMVGPACLTAMQVLAQDMSGTDVVVNFKDSASVTVDTVTMDQRQAAWPDRPRLTEAIIFSRTAATGDIAAMDVSISMLRVAKVRGKKWVQYGSAGPLVGWAVDLESRVTNSKHQVVLSDVGNVELEGVPNGFIYAFNIVHAVAQMKGSSELTLKVGNVANLRAPKHVFTEPSGALAYMDEDLEDSKVHVEIRDSFTLRVDELLLDTEILSKVFDQAPGSLKRSQMEVKVANSFNLYGSVLWIDENLIWAVVDLHSAPVDRTTVSVSLTGSFNMKGGAGSIVCVEAEVLPYVLKAWQSAEPTVDSKYDFVLKNVAQVQTSHFKMEGAYTLLGSVAGFDGIVGTDVTASVQQTANVKAEKVEMHHGDRNKANLMYYVFPVHSVDASSTVKLKLSGVAKVSASDLILSGVDLLSEVCYLEAPVTGSVSIDITDAANVGADTASFDEGSILFFDAASASPGGETFPTVQVSTVTVANLNVRKAATLARQSYLMDLRDTTFGKLSLMHTATATGKVDFEKTNSPFTSSRPCAEQDFDTRADSFINSCLPKAAPAPPAP